MKVEYHAIPHAVFTCPKVASVGLREKEAIERYGKDRVLIGIHRYQVKPFEKRCVETRR